MSEAVQTRHLFAPCIRFEVSVFPQGASTPTHLEKAAILLIASFEKSKSPLAIDAFIHYMSLGEPGGRDLLNGLWRKGWVVIEGHTGALYASITMSAYLKDEGPNATFADLGTAEEPATFTLFYDLITGMPFVADNRRISKNGRAPYLIEPFLPNSTSAPYGIAMESYLELNQQTLVETMKAMPNFRALRGTSEDLSVKLIAPKEPLSHKNIEFVRLFFAVARDVSDRFAVRGNEKSFSTLTQLAHTLCKPIEDKLLSHDTPLRSNFLHQIKAKRARFGALTTPTITRLQEARVRFENLENTGRDDVLRVYDEARMITQRAVADIRHRLDRAENQQVRVRYLPNRASVDGVFETLLDTARRQVLVASQAATAKGLFRYTHQKPSLQKRPSTLLIQTGGTLPRTKLDSLRNGIDREQISTDSAPRHRAVYTQYMANQDVYVDADVVVADANSILMTARSFFYDKANETSGFQFDLLVATGETRRKNFSRRNAANDFLNHMFGTFASPTPRLDMLAHEVAPEREKDPLELQINKLAEQLENLADGQTGLDEENLTLSPENARDLARLMVGELEEIDTLFDQFEQRSVQTAEGLEDADILDEACEILNGAASDAPIFIGIDPRHAPDASFVEALAKAISQAPQTNPVSVFFLDQPTEDWCQRRDALRAEYPDQVEFDQRKTLTNAQYHARKSYLPFVISSKGCVIASGGLTRRIIISSRRKDKKALGIVLRGRGVQEAPLEMVRALTGLQKDILSADLFFDDAPQSFSDKLVSSRLFQSWLISRTHFEERSGPRTRKANLSTSDLIGPITDNPELLARCLQDAKTVSNIEYENALNKAGVLAGVTTRDDYALALWQQGRILGASLITQSPPSDHMLADNGVRDFILMAMTEQQPSSDMVFRKEWLENDDLLALVALDLFDPSRRHLMYHLTEADIPKTKLGRVVRALLAYANAMPEMPFDLSDLEEEDLPFSAEDYCRNLYTATETYQTGDTGAGVSRRVQALIFKTFEPLVALNGWVLAQGPAKMRSGAVTQQTGDLARKVLRAEFGAEFEQKLSTAGKRDRVATKVLKDANRQNRKNRPTDDDLVGSRRTGQITAIARFLERLFDMHRSTQEDRISPFAKERAALRKAADAWLTELPPFNQMTARSILAETLRSRGETAPDGRIDFAMWRFPGVLEGARRNESRDVLGHALLSEEWPASVSPDLVFKSMLTNARFVAADGIVTCEASFLGSEDGPEALEEMEDRKLSLRRAIDGAVRNLLLRARAMEQRCLQLQEHESYEKAKELRQLYSDHDALDPQDVEDGAMDLQDIAQPLKKFTAERLKDAVDAMPQTNRGPWETVATASLGFSSLVKLSLLEHGQRPLDLRAPILVSPGSVGLMRRRLNTLASGNFARLEDARKQLELATASPRHAALIDSLCFAFPGNRHATNEDLHVVMTALTLLFEPEDGTPCAEPTVKSHTPEDATLSYALPTGGMREWLDWQFENHDVYILRDARSDRLSLDDLNIISSRRPIIINPFVSSPTIDAPHTMIDLPMLVAALGQPDAGIALQAAVAMNTPIESAVPWFDCPPHEQHKQLARFLGCAPEELVQSLSPLRYHTLMQRLLERLRVATVWSHRGLFDNEDLALELLGYASGGHLAETFLFICKANLAHGGGGKRLTPESILKQNSSTNKHLVQQAMRMLDRWHALQGLAPPKIEPKALPSVFYGVWVAAAKGADRNTIIQAISQRFESDQQAGQFVDWLIAETILTKCADVPGSFVPRLGHVLGPLSI